MLDAAAQLLGTPSGVADTEGFEDTEMFLRDVAAETEDGGELEHGVDVPLRCVRYQHQSPISLDTIVVLCRCHCYRSFSSPSRLSAEDEVVGPRGGDSL